MTDERSAYDDGQLPWLAAVEDEDEPRGVSAGKMFAALSVVVLAAAIVAGTFFWMGRRDAEVGGPPELIRAEAGPYKVKPPNPGGLNVAGDSETAYETSAGEDKDAKLDLSKVKQTPPPRPKEEPKRIPPNETKEPVAADSPPKATGGTGSVVQLGAFANRAQAERAWSALSARFPSVASATKMIVPFPGGIRLRAATSSAADARQVCQALKAAGENCFVAQ
ncbi:MAG: SPOR domain-containing protein [Sphingomicrobium sp.]